MLRQDIAWFDRPENASGILTSRLASDTTLVQVLLLFNSRIANTKNQGMMGMRLALTVQNFFSIAVGLAIAFYYGWKLTLVVLATSPLLAFANGAEMASLKGAH